MSKPVSVQILERARALIEDERHWCPGDLARDAMGYSVSPADSGAEQRCALGALMAAACEFTSDSHLAHDLACSAMRPLVGATSLTHINDLEGHTAVLALFDAAIAARSAMVGGVRSSTRPRSFARRGIEDARPRPMGAAHRRKVPWPTS
jgi:hypothetical protein